MRRNLARRLAGPLAMLVYIAMLTATSPGALARETGAGAIPAGWATVGRGKLEWFGFDVYSARLATPSGRYPGLEQAEGLALRIDYHRAVTAEKLVARTREEWDRLEGRAGLPPAEKREAWLSRLASMWPDVGAGDHIQTVHRPGGATEFHGSRGLLGRIEDPAFGPAFLAIWLHPETSAPDLRRALIGRDAGWRRSR